MPANPVIVRDLAGVELVVAAATMHAAATTIHLHAILAGHPDVAILLLPNDLNGI